MAANLSRPGPASRALRLRDSERSGSPCLPVHGCALWRAPRDRSGTGHRRDGTPRWPGQGDPHVHAAALQRSLCSVSPFCCAAALLLLRCCAPCAATGHQDPRPRTSRHLLLRGKMFPKTRRAPPCGSSGRTCFALRRRSSREGKTGRKIRPTAGNRTRAPGCSGCTSTARAARQCLQRSCIYIAQVRVITGGFRSMKSSRSHPAQKGRQGPAPRAPPLPRARCCPVQPDTGLGGGPREDSAAGSSVHLGCGRESRDVGSGPRGL